jgi:hypothetical protein
VQIGQNTNSYSISLSDEMLAAVRMSRVGLRRGLPSRLSPLTRLLIFIVRRQRSWLRHGTAHHEFQLERARSRTDDQPSLLPLSESPHLGAAARGSRGEAKAALAALDHDRRVETYRAQGAARGDRHAGGARRGRRTRLSRRRGREFCGGAQVGAWTGGAGGHGLRRVLQGSEGDIRVTCPRLVMTRVIYSDPVLYFHLFGAAQGLGNSGSGRQRTIL